MPTGRYFDSAQLPGSTRHEKCTSQLEQMAERTKKELAGWLNSFSDAC